MESTQSVPKENFLKRAWKKADSAYNKYICSSQKNSLISAFIISAGAAAMAGGGNISGIMESTFFGGTVCYFATRTQRLRNYLVGAALGCALSGGIGHGADDKEKRTVHMPASEICSAAHLPPGKDRISISHAGYSIIVQCN